MTIRFNTPNPGPRPMPQFGWGGLNAQKTPENYRFQLHPGDVHVTKDVVVFHPSFLESLYRRIYRDNLNEPGFVILTNLDKLFGDDMATIRRVQVALGEALVEQRGKALRLPSDRRFSMKYMGRSNKLKLNPIHCDTQYKDSLAMMLYEPSKNVRAWPFIADLSQYASDRDLPPGSLMQSGKSIKSHYGNQLKSDHHPAVLEDYAFDLSELNPHGVEMIILNDSIGDARNGHVHGVRKMELLAPDAERFFNHVVLDINTDPKPNPSGYFQKGTPEGKQQALSEAEARARYIQDGRIYYRKDH